MTNTDKSKEMKYLDHNPGQWFLLQWQGALYLNYRYSHTDIADDSAFMKLSNEERYQYDTRGREALQELAEAARNSGPYRKESPYYERNLFRGPGSKELSSAVGTAIADHTLSAEHPQTNKD